MGCFLLRALDAAIGVLPGSFIIRVSRRIVSLMQVYQKELSSLRKEKKAKVKYPESQEKLRKEELALKYVERIFVQACADLRT